MKQNKIRFITGSLLGALLLFGVAFTSCENEHPQINISLTSDYSGFVDAINSISKTLTEKLALIEGAIKDGTLKNQEAQDLIRQAIAALSGSMDSRLAAIEAAIKSQTTSLETKLALLEAAMKAQTLSLEGKLDLLKTAIESLPDYSGKFDAVVSALSGIKTEVEAVSSGQTGIATKIDGVISSIKDIVSELSSGNIDSAAALAAIIEKLDELKTAVENIGGGEKPEDYALPGKFSVSETKQVRFSKGNLQAKYDGSKYTFGFAANQYDFIGDAPGNSTISSQTSGAVVDLFGWSTPANNFGISTSTNPDDYAGDFVDWGTAIDDKGTWRTLTKDDWSYLTGSSTERKGKSKISTVCGIGHCRVIAPDDWNTETNPILDTYDEKAWQTAEAEGLVCLPPAGSRLPDGFNGVGSLGFYCSASLLDGFLWYYTIGNGFMQGSKYYHIGLSVRLVTEK